jgi:hypothetical protein
VQTRADVRAGCEKCVWALDFALPRERTGESFGRIETRRRGVRKGKRARDEPGGLGRVRVFSPERKQKRVVERERARTSANANECG